MLSLGLRRIHADHASSLQVPGFRVGTVLTVAGPPFALKEKLDKDIQYEYKTETHENRKKQHRRLTLSVPKPAIFSPPPQLLSGHQRTWEEWHARVKEVAMKS